VKIKQQKKIFLILMACLLLTGCARYRPQFSEKAKFFTRLQTQEEGNVKVGIVGLSPEEAKKTFGVKLSNQHILPLWIRIENKDSKRSYFFLIHSVDPDYYTPDEAAYMSKIIPGKRLISKIVPSPFSYLGFLFAPVDYFFVKPANERMMDEFKKRAIGQAWITPGEVREGFVFVTLDLGVKEAVVNLYANDFRNGKGTVKAFEFFVNIPGIRPDYRTKDFESYYKPDQIVDIKNDTELKKKIEELPCCTANKKGVHGGDPMNLTIIGTLDEILAAFTAANWDETEIIYWTSTWKTIKSFSFNKRYMYSPMSPLYFYGRSHDIALQKARSTIHERMHLRLWMSPMRYKGKPVWVGAVSRDIGVKFTSTSWNLITHKIDPEIDESVIYVMADLFAKQRVKEWGTVGGIPPSTPEKPTLNFSKAPYFTKGKRLVAVISESRIRTFPDRFDWNTYAYNLSET
jgi:hypothetical protein